MFENWQLLERDREAFEKYWRLNALQEQIVYHVGLDFAVGAKDTLIFDEADEFIFNDPSHFASKTANKHCICLTATPDN